MYVTNVHITEFLLNAIDYFYICDSMVLKHTPRQKNTHYAFEIQHHQKSNLGVAKNITK